MIVTSSRTCCTDRCAAAGLALVSQFLLFIIVCAHSWRRYPHPIFCFVSLLAFLTALAGFAIALFLFITGLTRFHDDGFSASLGPSVRDHYSCPSILSHLTASGCVQLWMALGAVILLFGVALNAGCGTCLGGRFGRQSRRIPYTY